MGGRDNSIEGLQVIQPRNPALPTIPYANIPVQRGVTHAFVVEFENEADREFYVKEDQAHLRFIQTVGPFLTRGQVVDFVPGVL